LIVKIDDIDSLSADIKSDFDFEHCPFIHNSSIVGVINERLGVFMVFFDELPVRLIRFDVVVVVLALPIAVLTAGTVVDEEFVA